MNRKKIFPPLFSVFLLLSFLMVLAVPVHAAGYFTDARTIYKNTAVQIKDVTTGATTAEGTYESFTWTNHADDIEYIAYANGTTFVGWDEVYGSSVTSVSNSSTYDAGVPVIDAEYRPEFTGTSGYAPFPLQAILIAAPDTCTIYDITTGQTDTAPNEASLAFNSGDALQFSVSFQLNDVLDHSTVYFYSTNSTITENYIPFVLQDVTSSLYADVFFTGAIYGPTPPPSPSPSPSLTSFSLTGFKTDMTSLLEMIIGAVFTFLGLLILMKFSAAWIIGLICLLAGFFTGIIAEANLYGVASFALENLLFSVFLYTGTGKGGQQSK